MKPLDRDALLGGIGLCAAGAVACSGHDGWGWILFATLLIVGAL